MLGVFEPEAKNNAKNDSKHNSFISLVSLNYNDKAFSLCRQSSVNKRTNNKESQTFNFCSILNHFSFSSHYVIFLQKELYHNAKSGLLNI